MILLPSRPLPRFASSIVNSGKSSVKSESFKNSSDFFLGVKAILRRYCPNIASKKLIRRLNDGGRLLLPEYASYPRHDVDIPRSIAPCSAPTASYWQGIVLAIQLLRHKRLQSLFHRSITTPCNSDGHMWTQHDRVLASPRHVAHARLHGKNHLRKEELQPCHSSHRILVYTETLRHQASL